MKKLLLGLALLITVQQASAQFSYQYFDVLVWDSTATGMPGISNYPAWFKIYSSTHGDTVLAGFTGNLGFGSYRDSLPTSYNLDSVKFYTYDCHENEISRTKAYNDPYGLIDTLYPGCLFSESCNAGLIYQQSSSVPLTIGFEDTTNVSPVSGTYVNRFCFFGDNDSSIVSKNFSHTYSQPGKYYVFFKFMELDTINGMYSCYSSVGDTIEVLASPSCQASYTVDTVNSGNGTAIIYNTSAPPYNDSAYIISYHWDFGDGDTSGQPFPTHTYDTAGVYPVCLTIEVDSAGIPCTSVFCDTLGVDTLGNLIYKSGFTGFTLKVLNPETVGLDEEEVRMQWNVYPNPAKGYLNISRTGGASEKIRWILTDLKGAPVSKGGFYGDEQQIDMWHLPEGIYLLNLKTAPGYSRYFKVVKE